MKQAKAIIYSLQFLPAAPQPLIADWERAKTDLLTRLDCARFNGRCLFNGAGSLIVRFLRLRLLVLSY